MFYSPLPTCTDYCLKSDNLFNILVKIAKMVILAHVACGQLVTNMVNMGVHQIHNKN